MGAGVQQRELGWDEFLEEVLPEARRLAADSSSAGIDRYLAVLAAAAARVAPERVAAPGSFGAYKSFPEEIGFALTHRGTPFVGVQFKIEPGAFLPYHPHPGGSVCTLFLEGAARVTSFEFVEEPDWETPGPVLVRRTREDLLLPGRVHLVGNPRDNIHGFRAGPQGARGIDITTGNRPESARPDTLIEIGELPRDEALGLFEGEWRMA